MQISYKKQYSKSTQKLYFIKKRVLLQKNMINYKSAKQSVRHFDKKQVFCGKKGSKNSPESRNCVPHCPHHKFCLIKTVPLVPF